MRRAAARKENERLPRRGSSIIAAHRMGIGRSARIAIAIVASLSLFLTMASSASAEVLFNERSDVAFAVENACAPADGLIAVTGFVHVVLREQDGVFYIHNNWQMSGVSANGTRYEGQRSIEVASATGSFSYSSRTRWVSQGPSDNMYFTFTAQFPPGTFSMETDCRG